MQTHKVLLMILDGFGIGDGSHSDAIRAAGTPFIDSLKSVYPNSQLIACGESVGLPDGQMGNSEVGHLTIGAGRVLYQDLVKINKAIDTQAFYSNPEFVKAINYAKENGSKVHLIGLASHGGVHSSFKHLLALCDGAKRLDFSDVFVHCLTDGRDVDPGSALKDIAELKEYLKHSVGKIASICGRYYTMDRDKRWARIKEAYDLLVRGVGTPYTDPVEAVRASLANDVTDEFIKPEVIVDDNGKPVATISANDVVICFNFRTDRLREITTVLSQKDMPEEGMNTIPLYYVTMSRYDEAFKNVHVLYDKDNVKNSLGEIVSRAGLTQLRIAETEKYAHVTFFFSGGQETIFEGEDRILVHSPKVATYDLQPEMSAPEVKDKLVEALKKDKYSFICLNFANCDMVGHTGVYDAIKKAVVTVDACTREVVNTAREHAYDVLIIADHGNADFAVNEDGTPNTFHSLNPVPAILVSERFKSMQNGTLADVAPTLLKMMGLEPSEEMTGQVLCH